MKQTIILMFIASLSFIACKKNVDNTSNSGTTSIIAEASVPSSVLITFNASFSASTEREWRKDAHNKFICQYNMDSQRHEAAFDDSGHESSHSVICLDAPVPANVLSAFVLNFPTDLVNEWKLTNENTWKAHFTRGTISWEVIFSASGTILSSEHD